MMVHSSCALSRTKTSVSAINGTVRDYTNVFVRFALEKVEHVHTSILVLIDTKSIALKVVLDHPGPQNHQDSTDWH